LIKPPGPVIRSRMDVWGEILKSSPDDPGPRSEILRVPASMDLVVVSRADLVEIDLRISVSGIDWRADCHGIDFESR